MIVSLLTGRKNSKGFPDKHFCQVGEYNLAYYPIRASRKCKDIDKRYISTDDVRLIEMAKKNNTESIERPAYLAGDKALSEDVFVYTYDIIKKIHQNDNLEMIVILMCNAACITSKIISDGINVLRKNPDYDSAVTVSRYNMWSPIRARRIDERGLLKPCAPFEYFENVKTFNCDRDSQGDVWFADMGVSIIRPYCIENIKDGLLPQKWMGKNIYPLRQERGLDVDYEWQIPQIKQWIDLYGENED